MSVRGTSPAYWNNPGCAEIVGSFAPNGTSAVDADSTKGRGFSVSRTGVGTFLVTFDRVGQDVVSATATLQLNAAADSKVQIGAIDLSAKTMVVRTITGTAAADISANANNRVNLRVVFRNTSVT